MPSKETRSLGPSKDEEVTCLKTPLSHVLSISPSSGQDNTSRDEAYDIGGETPETTPAICKSQS